MKIAILEPNEFYRNYLKMILPLLEGVNQVIDLPTDDRELTHLQGEQPDIVIFDPCQDNQVDLGLFSTFKNNAPDYHLIAYLEPSQEKHGETLYRMGVRNVLSKSAGTEYLRYILRQLIHQIQQTKVDSPLKKLAAQGTKVSLKHRGIRPLKAPEENSELVDFNKETLPPETKAASEPPQSPRSSQNFSSPRDQRRALDKLDPVERTVDPSPDNTMDMEPSESEQENLSALRMRLIRKRQETNEDQAHSVSQSFQKIWKEKQKTGKASGYKVKLFR